MLYRVVAMFSLGLASAACQGGGMGQTMPEVKEMAVESELAPMSQPASPPKGTLIYGVNNGEEETYEVVSSNQNTVTMKAGDCRWTKSKEYGVLVSPTIKWENCSGSTGRRDISGVEGGPIWPLENGKSWTFQAVGYSGGNSWPSDTECNVSGTARVQAAGRAYDTYKVVCEDRWRVQTDYIAPDVGYSVVSRQVRNDPNSEAREYVWRLKRVQKPADT